MSAERIDHAAEARAHIERAHDQQAREGEFDESVQHNAALALAEATLALVEQQRIANRIALGMYINADGSRPAQSAVTRLSAMSTVGVHADIREALGLS